ncbi:sigma factor-like helix-turn-helix DNA-binding protein [Streptomyces sp. NBC_01381]|uniref:sigma factor-like helix-turn-helix DNA-binding protein n=1 Tax=Streptomyces sp. NBC_01381 TaxID=2903845 RepID=UPI0033906127
MGALLLLPERHRLTLLMCDGLGMSISQAAAETAASTSAVRNRLRHARAAIRGQFPEVDDDGEALRERFRTLVRQKSIATVPAAKSVRAGSERRVRALMCTVVCAVAVLIGLIAASILTSTAAEHDRPSAHGRAAAHASTTSGWCEHRAPQPSSVRGSPSSGGAWEPPDEVCRSGRGLGGVPAA